MVTVVMSLVVVMVFGDPSFEPTTAISREWISPLGEKMGAHL